MKNCIRSKKIVKNISRFVIICKQKQSTGSGILRNKKNYISEKFPGIAKYSTKKDSAKCLSRNFLRFSVLLFVDPFVSRPSQMTTKQTGLPGPGKLWKPLENQRVLWKVWSNYIFARNSWKKCQRKQ